MGKRANSYKNNEPTTNQGRRRVTNNSDIAEDEGIDSPGLTASFTSEEVILYATLAFMVAKSLLSDLSNLRVSGGQYTCRRGLLSGAD
jgi:hypothetical protein